MLLCKFWGAPLAKHMPHLASEVILIHQNGSLVGGDPQVILKQALLLKETAVELHAQSNQSYYFKICQEKKLLKYAAPTMLQAPFKFAMQLADHDIKS